MSTSNVVKPLGDQGSSPDPADTAYSAPTDPLAGGEGLATPPQEPHSRSRPFRPRTSWPSATRFKTLT